MDWFRAVNSYCERTGEGYWSDPVNALSNASFLIAACLCWRLLRGKRDAGARLLAIVLAAIGVGSYLFHTHAQVWAMLADVIPILVFILVYIHLATVRFLALPVWAGLAAAAAYIPLSAAVSAAIGALTGPLNGSVGYLPVLLLIAGYAAFLRRSAPETARGLALGAALLSASLTFRTIDRVVCPAFPLGSHFLWHLLNGALLGWMIVVLVRHGAPPLHARARRGKGALSKRICRGKHHVH